MAIHDVECCEEYQTHEDLLKLVHEQMPDEDELYDLAELFKVFGESEFYLCCLKQKCVCVTWQKH